MKRGCLLVLIGFLLTLVFYDGPYADAESFAASEEFVALGAGEEGTTWQAQTTNARIGLNGDHSDFSSTVKPTEYERLTKSFSFGDPLLLHENLPGRHEKTWVVYAIDKVAQQPIGVEVLKDSVNFSNLAPPPHLGICWDHEVGKNNRWAISFDLGVAFPGFSEMDLDWHLSQATAPKFLANADSENQNLKNPIKSAAPFIGVGITYRF